jgi:gamma-tubulin complex component 5
MYTHSLTHERTLYPITTSGSLLVVLNRERHLLEHLEVLRKYLLFEAGGAMHPVCLHVFETMPPSPAHGWDREAEYTDLLQKAMADGGHGRHAHRMFVSLPKGRQRPSGALGAIGALKLMYAVPAPVDLVIDRAAMHVYSDAFSFLLQLKWAKWNLDTAHTHRGFAWSSGGTDAHRALLLRWRLSRTVDAVLTYVSTHTHTHTHARARLLECVAFQGGRETPHRE